MRQKSDTVFLLTLVDLLVQIIFLAIFVGAVYVANDGKEDIEKKRISDPKAKIIVEVGVLKVAELVTAMVKLVPIERLMELAVLLPEFKSIEALKAALRLVEVAKYDPKIIDQQKKELEKKTAIGAFLPTCSLGTNNKNLLSLQEQSEFYIVSMISPTARDLFNQMKVSFQEGDKISFQQFDQIGKFIINFETQCRYSVIYEPTLRRLDPYTDVQKYFRPQRITSSSTNK